jgi:hypothetical protein
LAGQYFRDQASTSRIRMKYLAKCGKPKNASIAGSDCVFLILNSCEITLLTMYRIQPRRLSRST